ncbi:MAG: hypothetical protein KA165_07890 [Saprospiraceae bacterium]|nr:hypothetical protein [Saprospiraceae bacterium]
MKKALRLDEIDAALDKFQPVTPDHEFYVNFENVRGDFQEIEVMRILNAERKNGHYVYNAQANRNNKTFLFLAGMRGSGKTSELARYAQLLNSSECFFVVTCNIDEELDMDNVQYMDILIFQLEKLLWRAAEIKLKLDDDILESMQKWFQDRVMEINRSLTASGGLEIETGVNQDEHPFSVAGILGKLLGITAKLKAELGGSYERAENVRETFRRRFGDFSTKFNAFIEQTNDQLRREKKAQEVLFIVDGLEKTMSAETRRRIIMEESNRLRQIRANTLFTLPIELMKERQRIRQFAEIVSFPFVKLYERDGKAVEVAVKRFEELVEKRIDKRLFDSPETVHLAIKYSGGSPRQLLRILERASWLRTDEQTQITHTNVQAAIEKVGNDYVQYLEPAEWAALKQLKTDLDKGNPIGFDETMQGLLEKEIVFEYNDGTFKRVNPLVEVSKLYRHHVSDQL